MHLFAGKPREGDIGEVLNSLAMYASLPLLFLSADLAFDEEWDLGNPQTFSRLYDLCRCGLIDVIFGGPPCATVAKVRHRPIPGGPRPLRWRSEPWGRKDLTPAEQRRVEYANTLWINFFSLADAVVEAGGAYGLEHPEDPRVEPFPSIFVLPELHTLEQKASATRACFDQGVFGAPTVKPTEVSGNLDGLDEAQG